ncbi:MAG: hypothetical protein QM780_13130 [Hyphomicrobium sp.]|uniref:hypothetical protein n=1 Tax=Hyphomicrobium sp. TaxID=82 RepID=UPI0039E3FD84
MPAGIDCDMPKEASQVFARRARLSSKAIVTAVALTLAALIATFVAAHHGTKTSILDPDTRVSSAPESGFPSVVNR